MEGTLWKWTNFFSGWQQRWFVLENGILSYYLSQDQVVNGCKGSVKVSVCDLHVHPTDPTRLDLVIPNEAYLYLKAPTQQERQRWLIALGSCKACLGDGRPVERSRDEAEAEQLRRKRSELRLYADLIRQQVTSVKGNLRENEAPDVEKLNEATSLLHATCDTLLRTLDDCMTLAEAPAARARSHSQSNSLRPASPATGGPHSPGSVLSASPLTTSHSGGRGSAVLELVNGGDASPGPLTTPPAQELWHPPAIHFESCEVTPIERLETAGAENGGDAQQLPPLRRRTQRHLRENHTFFSTLPTSFEDIRLFKDTDDLPTVPFIEACKSIVEIFSLLNQTALAPVKLDLTGNIRKLQQKYSTNPKAFATIQSIVRVEMEAGQQWDNNSATVATLWLKRGLEFVRELLVELLKNEAENTEIMAYNAYSRTLRQYHGWVVRGVFALAAKSLATREAFLAQLALCSTLESPDQERVLVEDMRHYLCALSRVTEILHAFYLKHGLNQSEKI